MGREVVGALSADRPASKAHALQEDARVLSIVASLIAQAVRLRQSAQEERERLMEENLRLQDELKDRFRPSNIIGNSKAMQEVYKLIAQVSRQRHDGAPARGERHGQGAGGARHSLRQPARDEALRESQLRGPS